MKIIEGNFGKKENDDQESTDRIYTDMMLELIKPHISSTPQHDELEDILSKGIIAWNMATIKAGGLPVFESTYNHIIENSAINKKGKVTIDKMIKDKIRLFNDFQNFVEDFEIEADEQGLAHIRIISKTEGQLLEEQAEEDWDMDMDLGLDMDDYEEGYINRQAITVTRKEPFYAWLKNNKQVVPPDVLSAKPIVYLVEEKDNDKETTKWLKNNFDKIFLNELMILNIHPDHITGQRTYRMFTGFFEIKHYDTVYDLEEVPIMKG